jgi:hypothetical protein
MRLSGSSTARPALTFWRRQEPVGWPLAVMCFGPKHRTGCALHVPTNGAKKRRNRDLSRKPHALPRREPLTQTPCYEKVCKMCRPWASRTVAPEVGRVLLSFGSAPSSPAALALPIVPGAAFALPHPKHLRTSSDPPAVLAHNTRRPGSPSSASLAYRGGAMRCYKVRPELRRTIFSVNYAVTAEATGRIRIRSW